MFSILSSLRNVIIDSVSEVYLVREILIVIVCRLESLFVSNPHDKTL